MRIATVVTAVAMVVLFVDLARGAVELCGGPTGIRTPDLLAASQALYQLSYGPSFA